MPKVPNVKRPEDDGSFPWMRLGQAVYWAMYRRDLPSRSLAEVLADPDIPGDDDEMDLIASPDEVRLALAGGKLAAWGQVSFTDPPELIPAVAWASRPVSPFDNRLAYLPYEVIRVDRHEVLKLWPSGEQAATRGGRPDEFDWEAIRSWAADEPKAQSQNKVAEVLRALCVERGRAVPSLSRMKEKLKIWGWPNLAGN